MVSGEMMCDKLEGSSFKEVLCEWLENSGKVCSRCGEWWENGRRWTLVVVNDGRMVECGLRL